MEQRLGRGLDSLISKTLQASGQASTQELGLAEIRVNPGQPRRGIDDDGLAELAASIATHGVLQPIVVRRIEGGFEIIAGERRFRAAKLAGKSKIPATIVDADGIKALELAIVENIQRENLTALDEAAAYQQLIQGRGLTHQELAERIGKSRASVTNMLRLLELPVEVRAMLQDGSLSAGQARALLGTDSIDQLKALASEAVAGKWTVRDVEQKVRSSRQVDAEVAGRAAVGKRVKSPQTRNRGHYEDELRGIYGTRVTIQDTGGKGEIRFAFYSANDLDRLLHLLLTARDSQPTG